MAQLDYENAQNPSFIDEATQAEFLLNLKSIQNIFEGDIEYDSDSDLPDNVNRQTLKWQKDNHFVKIPYTFPSTASSKDKAKIAKTIIEFRRKSCIK